MLDKKLYAGFARFFEQPSLDTLRGLLEFGAGEADRFDFKEKWPDRPKIAKHVLAIANYGGGALIVGVTDSGDLAASGLAAADKVDKTDIEKKLAAYLPPALKFDILDFDFKADSEYIDLRGKSFQVLIVESHDADLPYLCVKGGEDIKANVAYIRKRKESTEANHEELQDLINRHLKIPRVEVSRVRLKNDIETLRLLYAEMEKFSRDRYSAMFAVGSLLGSEKKSQYYPKESLDAYIGGLIVRLKNKIDKDFID